MDYLDYIDATFYRNFLLMESWKQYTIPSNKKLLLYDFYVLSYMTTALLSPPDIAMQRGSFVGRTEDELKSNIKEIEHVLLPFLKKEFRHVLFIAIASELRHIFTECKLPYGVPHETYADLFDSSHKAYADLFVAYSKRWANKSMSTFSNPDGQTDKSDIDNMRFALGSMRLQALKVAKYAMNDTNSTTVDFVKMAEYLFTTQRWTYGYGGKAWASIAEAYVMLNQDSSKDFNNLQVVIDHIYDLQHNNDTVFNKIMDYASEHNTYKWIKDALDFKASITNVRELLNHCSSQMRKLANEVFKITGIPKLPDDVTARDPAAKEIYDYINTGNLNNVLSIYNLDVKQFPPEFTEVGSLNIYGASKLIHLPEEFRVRSSLYLVSCPLLKKLPDSIYIGDLISINDCDSFYEISDRNILFPAFKELEIRILNCDTFQHLKLTTHKNPKITIMYCPSFTEIPDGAYINYLNIVGCKSFKTLPSNLKIRTKIRIDNCDSFYNEFIQKYPNHGDSDVDYPNYDISIISKKAIIVTNK